MLIELENYLNKKFQKEMVIYTIINNGFYEEKQTNIAFEIMENWCRRSGVVFGGGIGQGAGEMIGATKNIPLCKGPFRNLGRELKSLVKKIEIKNPRLKGRGIEDFSLKYLRMRGNKSPSPPVLRPKGRGIKPKRD